MSLKLLRDVPFGAVLCLVGTNYINSANAQQTDQQTIVTKAEAALAAKIKWEDFKKNTNGTWTSAPNTWQQDGPIEERIGNLIGKVFVLILTACFVWAYWPTVAAQLGLLR